MGEAAARGWGDPVTSYSKQMMAIAKEWADVNSDPEDEMIMIPSFERRRFAELQRTEKIDEFVEENRRFADRPDLAVIMSPLLAEVREASMQRQKASKDLRDVEDDLEHWINMRNRPSHRKHAVSDDHLEMGRWLIAWARHGYNVLDLSSDFTAAMLLTDPSDLDIASIRLPFAGILMIVPDGFATGSEGGHYTKIHICEVSMTLTGQNQIEVGDNMLSALKSIPAHRRPAALEKIERRIAEHGGVLPPRSLLGPPVSCDLREPGDGTAIHIHATDGSHVLDTYIERRGLTWSSFDDLPSEITEDSDLQVMQTIRRIVFGTLAYIASVGSAIERREPAGHRRAAKVGESPVTWNVGRTIRLDKNLVRAVRAGAREVAFRLKHRHIVRGHYRNQAHGARRADRKRIWIAPFWKGPEDGAALVHTYRIDGTKEG